MTGTGFLRKILSRFEMQKYEIFLSCATCALKCRYKCTYLVNIFQTPDICDAMEFHKLYHNGTSHRNDTSRQDTCCLSPKLVIETLVKCSIV